MTEVQAYSLGASELELDRLDAQAANSSMPTAMFLRSAGIAPGPALLSGVVNSLAPVIVASGIATEEELALDSLQMRLSCELQANKAVGLMPAVAGARGRRRARA